MRDRKNLLDRYGIERPEKDRIREKSEGEIKRTIRVIMERVGQKEREGRRRRIEESRYNSEYEKVMIEHRPDYLREVGKMKDKRLIATFRCGNELRGEQF